jgi:hypothetical protein
MGAQCNDWPSTQATWSGDREEQNGRDSLPSGSRSAAYAVHQSSTRNRVDARSFWRTVARYFWAGKSGIADCCVGDIPNAKITCARTDRRRIPHRRRAGFNRLSVEIAQPASAAFFRDMKTVYACLSPRWWRQDLAASCPAFSRT